MILKVLLLTLLIVTSQSRLLAGMEDLPQEDKNEGAKEETKEETKEEAKEETKEEEKKSEDVQAVVSNPDPSLEPALNPGIVPVVEVEDKGPGVASSSAVSGQQPRGKRFYILMGVVVLMIGAVCTAFILGKPKE